MTENEPQAYDWGLLEDAVEFKFDGWRPEPGETLLGTVAYVSEGEGNWGPYPMVAIISREGEAVMVHAFHTILRNEIERQAPATGDKIAVKYHGVSDKPVERGDPPHLYTVVIDKANRGMMVGGPAPAALPERSEVQHGDTAQQDRGEPPGWESQGDGSVGEASTPAVGAGTSQGEASPSEQIAMTPTPAAGGAGSGPAVAVEPEAATGMQRNAIDTLREKAGMDPIDWATTPMSMEEASALIKRLQG